MSQLFWAKIKGIATINLFKSESSTSRLPFARQWGQISTRIYLITLTSTVIVLVILNKMTPTYYSVVVPAPDLETFERLQVMYPATLSCPCQQISIPYKDLYSINPVFHQVSYSLLRVFDYRPCSFIFV